MATIGMMTAIAIFAPELKPLECPDPEPDALSAEGVEDAIDEVCVVAAVAVSELVSWAYVDVTATTEGVGAVVTPGGVDEGVGVCVRVSVTSTTLGVLEVV